jgi:hypothetical protein
MMAPEEIRNVFKNHAVPDEPETNILNLEALTLPIEDAVYLAIGAASTCWENPGEAGIFDEARAKQIGNELIAYFKSKGPNQ